jgi:hypothetical protein
MQVPIAQSKKLGFFQFLLASLKKQCRGFYVSQNILLTSFEIDQIQNIIDIGNCLFSFQEVEKARTLGYGSESRAGQKIIFQIKYTRDVKSMIRVVESKQKDIRRWSMTIYIDSTDQKR